jgi:hypothetical protein
VTKVTVGLPTAAQLKQLDTQEEEERQQQLKQMEQEFEQQTKSLMKAEAESMDIESVQSSSESRKLQLLPPSLALPNDQTWSVMMLEASPENIITVRLVETSIVYMDFLDKLSNFYENSDKYGVQVPMAGRIYAAVSSDNTVLRVQVESFDQDVVRCIFVDEGGAEHLDQSCLREIPEEIVQLPFQAFNIKLHGLDTYEKDERVAKIINNRIEKSPGLALIVQPISHNEPIEVALWDTTGDKDIILNEAIVNYLRSKDEGMIEL